MIGIVWPDQKNENLKKWKIRFRLKCASFFHCLQDFVHTLEINSVLSISLNVLIYIWCIHAWYEKYEMTCYAQKCLINHALLPKYVQNLEDNERKKRILT